MAKKESINKKKNHRYKILILGNVNLAQNDAQTTHLIELLENFKKIGHKAIILVPKRGVYYEKIPEIKYVPIICIPLFRIIINRIIFSFYLFFYRFLLGPEFIYIRFEENFLEAIVFSKILRVPVFTEINGLPLEEGKLNNRSIFRLFFIRLTFFTYLKFSNRIVTVTEGIKKELLKKYKVSPSKIKVVPNGANTSLFRPVSTLKCRRELRLKEGFFYICFVGNIVYWQGLDYLVKSAPLILKKIPNVKFLIVGDGPTKEDLLRLVKQENLTKNFIFINSVPYRDVPKYINASDICVLYKIPMKSGFSPLKLYEYMACKKPVVATDTKGLEIVKENNTGLLVAPQNSTKLAEAIITLLKDEELRKKMGENGRNLVVKNYSWNASVKKIINIFEDFKKTKNNFYE